MTTLEPGPVLRERHVKRWPLIAGALVGLLVAVTARCSANADSPAASDAVRLELKADRGTYLLKDELSPDAQPPAGSSCEKADAWIREQGGLHFRTARWRMAITAQRLAQVEIVRVRVRVVDAEHVREMPYSFACADPNDPTSWSVDDSVPVPGYGDLPIPWFSVGASPGHGPDDLSPGGNDLVIGSHLITLNPSEEFVLPIVFEGADSNTTYRFVVEAKLRVNGLEIESTLGDNGKPIGLTWGLLRRGPVDYQWNSGPTPTMSRDLTGS
jgi:hypothetical protein